MTQRYAAACSDCSKCITACDPSMTPVTQLGICRPGIPCKYIAGVKMECLCDRSPSPFTVPYLRIVSLFATSSRLCYHQSIVRAFTSRHQPHHQRLPRLNNKATCEAHSLLEIPPGRKQLSRQRHTELRLRFGSLLESRASILYYLIVCDSPLIDGPCCCPQYA